MQHQRRLSVVAACVLVACGGGDTSVTPAGPPVVSAISPLAGIGSTTLTITGTNFGPGAVVRIGGEVARVTSATATSLLVDLCNANGTDCEPRGGAVGGGALPVTVTVSGQAASAPASYFLYTSASFLVGDWETELPASSAGIVMRISGSGTTAVITKVPATELGFAVGDTVNRDLTRSAPYRWLGRGLLINAATQARVFADVSITPDGADAMLVSFGSGTSSRRKRLNPSR